MHSNNPSVEGSVSLRPIDEETAHARRRTLGFVVGGAAALWLLLLPLTVRVARAIARDWTPGRRGLLRAFRQALARDEIELAYQPQVDPASGAVLSVEALVRWRRGGELIAPDRFLPIVESSPLMPALTDRVGLALTQLAAWHAEGHAARMSVNLSATDLGDRTLPSRIAARLAQHGLSGEHLTVEVTETAILEDVEEARNVLIALARVGVDVAIDDFGTGLDLAPPRPPGLRGQGASACGWSPKASRTPRRSRR
jgi:sensor c-di-GMP phosphodiesterase-like protein